MTQSPVQVAQELLELVKHAYGDGNRPVSQLSSFEAHEAKYQIEELCGQLLRTVLGPLEYTVLLAETCHESSALGFVSTLGVPDVIGDADMSIEEISDAVDVKPKYLKVVMNCLTRHGYFDEVQAPRAASVMYRNNELSDLLKTAHPSSLKDAVSFICDEGFKASSHMLQASKISLPKNSEGKDLAGSNIAFGFDRTLFEWMSKEEGWRGKRMGNAMQQLHRMANKNAILDYNWFSLPLPVVDVGGGIGSLELALLKGFPNSPLQFVLFDLPETIENAKNVWSLQVLPAQTSIKFQPGNFMEKEFKDTLLPIGKPTYLIRHVLHDWSDEEVLHILKHVRTAMSIGRAIGSEEKPQLVLCEMLMRPDSHRFIRTTSIQLLSLNGGMTRTETEMINLLKAAGFSIHKVHKMRAADTIIEATIV